MGVTKRNRFILVFGSILLLIVAVLLVFWEDINSVVMIALVAGGLVGIITGFSRQFGYIGIPEKDERTRKISAFAGAYSWFITLIVICILGMVDRTELLKMKAERVISIILFVMIVTMLGLHAYFKRKGDVE